MKTSTGNLAAIGQARWLGFLLSDLKSVVSPRSREGFYLLGEFGKRSAAIRHFFSLPRILHHSVRPKKPRTPDTL